MVQGPCMGGAGQGGKGVGVGEGGGRKGGKGERDTLGVARDCGVVAQGMHRKGSLGGGSVRLMSWGGGGWGRRWPLGQGKGQRQAEQQRQQQWVRKQRGQQGWVRRQLVVRKQQHQQQHQQQQQQQQQLQQQQQQQQGNSNMCNCWRSCQASAGGGSGCSVPRFLFTWSIPLCKAYSTQLSQNGVCPTLSLLPLAPLLRFAPLPLPPRQFTIPLTTGGS